MSAARLAAVLALSVAVSAVGGLRWDTVAKKADKRVGGSAKRRWLGHEQPEDMENAVFQARDNTWPQLRNDDSTDYQWYKDYYGSDAGNALEALSRTHPAVQPPPERLAAEEAREREALERLWPRLQAEEAEANNYWHREFPFDADNDLEEFSYTHNYTVNATGANETANGTNATYVAASMLED